MKFINIILCLCLQSLALPVLSSPAVTVSIKPIHSMVEPIMEGVSTPSLLMDSHQSAHHQNFTPGQFIQLRRSDIIIRISPFMETSIQHAISGLKQKTVITLMELPELQLLPSSGNNKTCDPVKTGSCNPHIWINTRNLHKFIDSISSTLANNDSENAKLYIKNASQLHDNLTKTSLQIKKEMLAVYNTRILALHNSWQYFAEEFNLNGYQHVEGGDFNHLGARSVLKWKERIRNGEIDCILVDPENNKKSVQSLASLNENVILVNANPMGPDENINIVDFITYVANIFSQCQKR